MKSKPPINIESEIDNKKSDDEMHQFIESVETENYANDLSQVQQQQLEPHHQTIEDIVVETIIQVRQPKLQPPRQETSSQPKQLMSRDSPIKMVDIHERQAQLEQPVISEIEGQNNEPDADDMISTDASRCTTIASRNSTHSEEVQNPYDSMRAQSYFRRATTRRWRKLCSARRQQRNLSASIKTA